MRLILVLFALLSVALGADSSDRTAVTGASGTAGAGSRPASGKSKFDPRISPEYLQLLTKHANQRKEFFEQEAKARSEMEERHSKEHDELVEKHRAAQKSFSPESHSQSERAAFFKSERNEMLALESRQDAELEAFEKDLKSKMSEQHTSQHKEREELANRLVKEHR